MAQKAQNILYCINVRVYTKVPKHLRALAVLKIPEPGATILIDQECGVIIFQLLSQFGYDVKFVESLVYRYTYSDVALEDSTESYCTTVDTSDTLSGSSPCYRRLKVRQAVNVSCIVDSSESDSVMEIGIDERGAYLPEERRCVSAREKRSACVIGLLFWFCC